jgi:hypothetical protein
MNQYILTSKQNKFREIKNHILDHNRDKQKKHNSAKYLRLRQLLVCYPTSIVDGMTQNCLAIPLLSDNHLSEVILINIKFINFDEI